LEIASLLLALARSCSLLLALAHRADSCGGGVGLCVPGATCGRLCALCWRAQSRHRGAVAHFGVHLRRGAYSGVNSFRHRRGGVGDYPARRRTHLLTLGQPSGRALRWSFGADPHRGRAVGVAGVRMKRPCRLPGQSVRLFQKADQLPDELGRRRAVHDAVIA
jgi:hypothetical protein